MTYRGRVTKSGTVLLDDPKALPTGTVVSVRALKNNGTPHKAAKKIPSLYERMKPFIGKAKGLPPDASKNIDHYLYGHPKRT